MGSRRLRPMTAADLSVLPEPCARCTFWETSLVDLAAPADHLDRRQVKIDWAEAVTQHWGYCGVLAQHDEQVIGHLCMAPARYVPRLGAFATTPVSPDAAVLLSARVVEEWRGKGIGRQLVQSAAGLVVRRDIRAWRRSAPITMGRPACCPPGGWRPWGSRSSARTRSRRGCGWTCTSSLRWPDLGAAWHRLAGLVGSPAAPEPASYAQREAAEPSR